MTDIRGSAPARRWIVAGTCALALHCAAFVTISFLPEQGAARIAGSEQAEIGTVSIASNSLSDLIQTAEPVAAPSEENQADPAETPMKEPLPQELETFENSSVVAMPAEPEAEVIEPVEEKPEKRPEKKPTPQPRRDSAAVSRSGGGASGSQAEVAGAAELAGYKDRVRARVAGRARSPGGSGLVIVRFTITSSGGVAGASIVRGSSGSLNSAALSAVNGGFPPIPPGLPRSISFTVPIQFR